MKKVYIFLLIIILSEPTLAFGVTSPYWDERPLVATPGTTLTIELLLQNVVSDNNIEIEAEITEGKEIASLIENTIIIPPNTKEQKFPITIQIPEDAKSSYTIAITFKQKAETQESTVQFTNTITKSFPIVIGGLETSPPEALSKKRVKFIFYIILTAFILGMAITLTIIVALAKKNKKRQNDINLSSPDHFFVVTSKKREWP